MPEVQEIFHMATQKVRPDPNALERQHRDQRRHAARQKATVFVLIGALVIGGAVFTIGALRSDQDRRDNVGTDPTASPLPPVSDGPLEPGRYAIATTDPEFTASHRITLDVPEGYSGLDGLFVFNDALVKGTTGLVIWPVEDVFVDACEWRGARSAVSSADDVVAALGEQKALRPTTPTDATVAGLAATYMELTTPSRARIERCDDARFTVWDGSASSGQYRYLSSPAEVQHLWILDVDGTPLVIGAPAGADASAQDRAELFQMVESIQIDLR
jgi:hypothetical protein